jgi:hypothetical protein
MREVTIHLDGSKHPIDIHFGNDTHPITSFLLLANVPSDPPGCVLLNYGNSSSTGNLLMTLFQRSVQESPELAWVIEQVARGIVKFSDDERGRWPSDDRSGKA